MTRLFMLIALSIMTLSAHAQAEEKMKALQMGGFGAQNAAAQASESAAQRAKEQVAEGDTDPSFPGGDMFLQAYLKKKLLHSGVSGKGDVVVSFRVDAKGNIYGAEVTKSAGGTLDTAAFNIVTGMPRWRPGLTNGEPADKPASVTVSFGKE